MTTTNTELQRGVIAGGLRYVIIKSVQSNAGTGGDVSTGFNRVVFADITTAGAAAATGAVINETFPLDSGDVTYACNANETVYIMAYGI
jgi:hypothetical protein